VRELRLATPSGLTNPLIFQVGQLTILKGPAKSRAMRPSQGREEGHPAATVPGAGASPERRAPRPPERPDRTRRRGPLPVPGLKGQRIVAAASVRELIPYISDAVPGWFPGGLALYERPGQAGGIRGPLRVPPRSGPLLCDPERRRVRPGNPGFHLPGPGGISSTASRLAS